MSESQKIPAASIDNVDLKRVAASSQTAADEIMRIGQLLGQGAETTGDLVKLCELLQMHGESGKSEELLRCNIVEENDVLQKAYRRLHGSYSEKEFERCVVAFADQFGLHLTTTRKLGFLKLECSSIPARMSTDIDPAVARFLSTPCDIVFQYNSSGCTADIYSSAEDYLDQEYLILEFNDRTWRPNMKTDNTSS